MKLKIIALIIPLCVSGCATKPSNASASYQSLLLPDVVQYTPTQLKEAGKEMDKNCPYMPIVCGIMLPDYLTMRDQTRAAN